MSTWTTKLRSTLAAAYVLGTLRGPARIAMKQRLARDSELRAAVHRWEQHFSVLHRGFKPVLPSEGQWNRLEAAAARAAATPPPTAVVQDANAMTTPPPLTATRPGSRPTAPATPAAPSASKGGARRQAPALGPQDVAPKLPPAVETTVSAAPVAPAAPQGPTLDGPIAPRAAPRIGAGPTRRPTARRAARPPRGPFPFLKVWAIAATVLAVVFGGLLSVTIMDEGTQLPEPQGMLIAALATEGGRWVVQSTATGEQILVQVEGTPKMPNNRSAELWWIGADGTPVSVGVLPATGRQVLTRQGLTGDEPAPTFAVSIEPSGGSPTGAPTGKVITTFTAVRGL